jgi:tetratricopeptide (TPR) repeat protein
MEQRESWQRALDMARRTLATLEEQAAGYTVLTIPASLVNEIEAKRQEIARLESLLADVEQDSVLPRDNLPRRVSFFGREKEIARAMDALSPDDRGWGLMIDGIGGIGKTALAVEVAYLCLEQARFDAFFFVTAKLTRLAPGGEQSTEDAARTLDAMLNEVARAMDCPGVAREAGAEKRRALLDELRRFSGPERRVLLILDNLETLPSDELVPLFEFLRRLPGHCKAIVTSRRRAGEGAVWLRLEKLDWEPAWELIADRMERDARLERTLTRAGEARWQELYDAAGGSPLALRWSLGLMSARNLSLDRALALLRGGAADDSPLHRFIYREARQDMGADDWRVLGALSLFAAPASFDALSSTTELTRLMLESALERLDAYALVDAAGPDGPYSLHPLTRQLAAGELAGQPEMGDILRASFARYWVDFAERYGGGRKGAYQTFHHLDAEWPNLEAAVEVLRNQVYVAALKQNQVSEDAKEAAHLLNDLARALRTFLWFRGHWEERVRLGEAAYQAMAALKDWRNAGWRARDAAWIHYNRAETSRATAWADRCAEAWERGGTRRDQAAATQMRGLVTRQRGDLDEAERLLAEALAAYRDLGAEGIPAIVLNDLGDVARERHGYDRAEGYYREALSIDEKRGHKEGQATDLGNLGNLALDRGRPDEARRGFERALSLAQKVGRQDLVAHAQWGLARVLEEEDRLAEALPLAQAALQIYERLRHKDLEETRQLVARLREQVGDARG